MCGLLLFHFFFCEELTDWLCGVIKTWIVWINLNLGYHCCNMPTLIRFMHCNAQTLLQVITNITLRHSSAFWEIHRGDGIVSSMSSCKCLLDHANLRAIAVRDNDFIALLDNTKQRWSNLTNSTNLILRRIAKRIASQRNNNTIGLPKCLCHGNSSRTILAVFCSYKRILIAALKPY